MPPCLKVNIGFPVSVLIGFDQVFLESMETVVVVKNGTAPTCQISLNRRQLIVDDDAPTFCVGTHIFVQSECITLGDAGENLQLIYNLNLN